MSKQNPIGNYVATIVSTLHVVVDLPAAIFSDEQKATMLIQVIDEAEQLLGPIQRRLQDAENGEKNT